MEITPANLGSLFLGYDMVFQNGMKIPESNYQKICTMATSASRENLYPFLGRTTKFREFLGPRVFQMLEARGYSLINKKFEDSVEVNKDDIEDDTYGVYRPMFEQLGWDAAVHPDKLVFDLIASATTNFDSGTAPTDTLCYDNKTFFSKLHPVGLAGAASAVANIDDGGSGAFWYLLDCSRPIKPFIWQTRSPYTMTRMNALTDEQVFLEQVFRFGVDARVNAGFGLWQLAYASNKDLSDPANYGAVRAAMRAIKTDAGEPFDALTGSSPSSTFLVVGPSNETNARQLLNSEFMIGTGASSAVSATAVWKNSATLIVSNRLT